MGIVTLGFFNMHLDLGKSSMELRNLDTEVHFAQKEECQKVVACNKNIWKMIWAGQAEE